jgi:hypothetical protein
MPLGYLGLCPHSVLDLGVIAFFLRAPALDLDLFTVLLTLGLVLFVATLALCAVPSRAPILTLAP